MFIYRIVYQCYTYNKHNRKKILKHLYIYIYKFVYRYIYIRTSKNSLKMAFIEFLYRLLSLSALLCATCEYAVACLFRGKFVFVFHLIKRERCTTMCSNRCCIYINIFIRKLISLQIMHIFSFNSQFSVIIKNN